MKIKNVVANNRTKAFEVETQKGGYTFPYAKLRWKPTSRNRVADVFVDDELGDEAFTYRLESGHEDTIHIDSVLEYNQDPTYLNELLLHQLTIEAQRGVEESGLSKREIIRHLGTSASQFYRLMDPSYYGKSVGQMLALLHLVGMRVDFVIKGSPKRQRSRAAKRK